MNLVYALILLSVSANPGGDRSAMSTVYFKSRDFCEAAKSDIIKATGPKASLILLCEPTGGGQ